MSPTGQPTDDEFGHRPSRPAIGSTTPRGLRRLVVALVATLALTGLLTGCGDTSKAELCTQYDKAVTQADEIRGMDLASEKLADLRAQLKDFQAALDDLQAKADGKLDEAISDLRAAVRDFAATVLDGGQEALTNAQQRVKGSLAGVKELWAAVQKRAENTCNGD